jgi:hypothetical protein
MRAETTGQTRRFTMLCRRRSIDGGRTTCNSAAATAGEQSPPCRSSGLRMSCQLPLYCCSRRSHVCHKAMDNATIYRTFFNGPLSRV